MKQLTKEERDKKWLERLTTPINLLYEVLCKRKGPSLDELRDALLEVGRVAVSEDPLTREILRQKAIYQFKIWPVDSSLRPEGLVNAAFKAAEDGLANE